MDARASHTDMIRMEIVNLPRPSALDIFRARQILVVTFSNNSQGVYMSKLLSVLIAAAFATVSVGSFAAAHGGAAKDDKKMEEKKPEAKKDEKKDEKKPEAKKDQKGMSGMSGMEAKKDEKKADPKKDQKGMSGMEAKKEEPKK
jgi:Ni/Co efflux regulator RcnB